MKLAVFGDLHGHTFKLFDKHSDRSGSERLDKIVDCLIYIRDYCYENNIKHVLFAGDLLHVRAKVNTLVFNAIYDAVKTYSDYDINLIMIPGNHDQVDNSDFPEHSLHAFKDLENVQVIDNPSIYTICYEGGTVDIVGIPYSKNVQMIKDAINTITQQELNNPILLGHMGVTGGVTGTGNYPLADAFTVEDLKPDFFKYIMLGHFHIRQSLGGYPHVWYTGSPIQHDFGDEGQNKGFLIIDTDKRWDVQAIEIPNPRFLTMNLYRVANEDMRQIADEGHYVRIQVKESELQACLSYLPPNLQYKIELQKEFVEQTRVDVKVGMSPAEIIKKYAQEFNPDAEILGLEILEEVEKA